MAGLVYRFEIIARLFGRCKDPKKKYIYYCLDKKYEIESQDSWQGKIKGIKVELERIVKQQEERYEKVEEYYR